MYICFVPILFDYKYIYYIRDIELNELLELNQQEIKSQLDSMGLSPVERNRFIKGINGIKHDYPNDTDNESRLSQDKLLIEYSNISDDFIYGIFADIDLKINEVKSQAFESVNQYRVKIQNLLGSNQDININSINTPQQICESVEQNIHNELARLFGNNNNCGGIHVKNEMHSFNDSHIHNIKGHNLDNTRYLSLCIYMCGYQLYGY